jgi:hypothetical protein
MEEFNISNFDLIDKAVTLVASRKSGKSYLITDLLYKTILKKYDNIDILNIFIFCQSLIDSNLYFLLYIYYNLLEDGYDIFSKIEILENFEFKNFIDKTYINYLVKNESDYIIKLILDNIVKYLKKKINKTKTPVLFTKTIFYFSGTINRSILMKLNNSEIKTNKNRKYIIIVDDVNKELYKTIKNDIIMIYEQGRHHDISIIVIDQYIKSEKVPPEIRGTSSHLIIRSFDEKIKKEIIDICAFHKNDLDIETIKQLINNYYCIIIDYNNKLKLYYYKSPSPIFIQN